MGLLDWLSQLFPRGLDSGSPSDAILHCDHELAESLRDTMTEEDVREVAEIYHNLGDWPPKDIAIHLLQDSDSEIVRSIMQDGLNSPTAEVRATALCWLTSDSGETFESFLNDGWVDPERVDAAIAAFRNS